MGAGRTVRVTKKIREEESSRAEEKRSVKNMYKVTGKDEAKYMSEKTEERQVERGTFDMRGAP